MREYILSSSSNNPVIDNSISNNGVMGVFIQNSNSNIILGNTIQNNSWVGIVLDNASSNIIYGTNNITGSQEGIFIANASTGNIIQNNIINYNTGNGIIILNSSNENIISNSLINNNGVSGIFIQNSNGTTIQYNTIQSNIWAGIVLDTNNTNTITTNTITNNPVGIYSKDSSANIHFNRIVENNIYGLYNEGMGTIDATNNWWGTNTPATDTSPYDIYFVNGTVDYEPWLILSLDVDSYTRSGLNASITADLIYNSNGEDTSSSGHVPDGIPVSFTTTNFETIISPVYTVKGKAETIVNVGSTQTRTGNISSSVDRESVFAQFTINQGTAILNIQSTALDISTGQNLNLSYTLPLNDSVSWVSVLWKNTGLFQEEMNLIINGDVVMSKNVVNLAYLTYMNSYSQQVFTQINYFNALFTNSAESRLLLLTLIADNPQLQNLTGTQLIDGILAVIKEDNNFTDSEIAFIKNNHWSFVDPINLHLNYTGDVGQSINITDPETNETMTLNFPGNSMSMGTSIFYRNGSFISQHYDQNNNPYLVVELSG